MSRLPNIKITISAVPGKAYKHEASRLALLIGGIPFEDERIPPAELEKRVASGLLPFNELPAIEIDGRVHAQSLAMLVYCCSLAGLYPDCPLKRLVAHEVLAGFDDMWGSVAPTLYLEDKGQRVALQQQAAAKEVAFFLGRIERILEKEGGEQGWAIGDSMTIADVFLFNMCAFLTSGFLPGIPPTLLEPYTRINRARALVAAHPKVAGWQPAWAAALNK